eukprot:TRINITY_DN8566_c0_g1_i1.p1 TRINITY_DN8566_c0_g1~~TRINITY_DN8566_c0_g1_i1.p1  ORF type:complete len:101 (+),score=2.60 TRINITY_DN8566_c0_g1_i1:85-387(+)
MSAYCLQPSFFAHEDILICVDTDPILDRLADLATLGYGVIWNIDCTQMALFFFVQAKLSINPDHRFSFCTLSQSSISWLCLLITLTTLPRHFDIIFLMAK